MLLRFPDMASRDAFRADLNADRKLPPGKHGTRSRVDKDDGYLCGCSSP
jgi:hypothetical protein